MSLLEVNQQSELFLTLNLAAPGSFEPGIDYVVTNPAMAGRALPSRCLRTATIPQADPTLPTQMKSVPPRRDGHRPHVQGKPAKMPALAGDTVTVRE